VGEVKRRPRRLHRPHHTIPDENHEVSAEIATASTSIRVRLFGDVEEAVEWLRERQRKVEHE